MNKPDMHRPTDATPRNESMEIRDYLTVARRRFWVIVLIPFIATAAAVAYILLLPAAYSATAVVSGSSLVGAPWSQYSGPQGDAQFAAAFAETAGGPAALKAAAASAKTTPQTLQDGVSVSQQGSSSNLQVTFVASQPSTAARDVAAITAATLDQMFAPQVKLAQSRVTAATEALSTANTDLTDLAKKYGIADPSTAYSAALSNYNSLQQTQQNLRADGKAVQAAALDDAISKANQQVQQFGPILAAYRPLQAAQQTATSNLAAANGDLDKASAQLSAAAPQTIVSVGAAQPASRLSSGAKVVIPVFGASLFLTFLVVAILEMLAAQRSPEIAADSVIEARHGTESMPSSRLSRSADQGAV